MRRASGMTAAPRKKSVADIFRDTGNVQWTAEAEEDAAPLPEYLSELTESQLATLHKLRDAVGKEDFPERDGTTGSFRLDDATLVRFLRANAFNGYKATCAVKEHLRFRQRYVPHSILAKHVRAFVESGFWTTVGLTKDGHPLELILAKKFNPQRFQGDDLVRALIYQRELVANMIRSKQHNQAGETHLQDDFVLRDRTLLLIDASEFNFVTQGSVQGMRQIRLMAELMQLHWPGTLGVAAVVNASVAFKWVFNTVIRRLLDEETANRVTFVSNLEELHELIDPAVLSKRYGGTLDDETHEPGINNNKASLRKTLVGRIKMPSSPATATSSTSSSSSTSPFRKSSKQRESTAAVAMTAVAE